MNTLKKIHSDKRLKSIRAKRKLLEQKIKELGRKYRTTFKKVAKKVSKSK